MEPEYVGVLQNAITMSWGDIVPVTIDPGETLFTLKFVATTAGELKDKLAVTSSITEEEAYHNTTGDDVELMDVTIGFGSHTVSTPIDFALYQNEPNPFSDQTVIGFDLPSAMSATVTLYDISGRVVQVIEGDYAQGYNEIILKRKDLSADGAYYYRLDAGDFTASKKMILTR